MDIHNNHIIYMCNQCFGMPHSFIDDRFLCMVHGFSFSWPACPPHGLPQGSGLGPFYIHRLHISIWSPLTACAVLGQHVPDCWASLVVSVENHLIFRLCLNSEKTEFLWCATSRRCPHLDTRELSVCGSLIRPVTVARDLGVMLQS